VRDTLQQIDLIHRLVERYSNVFEFAERTDDILRIFNRGRVACLIGVEGLHQIGNSASVLRMYHRLGVRYVTLTHVQNNLYADSAVSGLFRTEEVQVLSTDFRERIDVAETVSWRPVVRGKGHGVRNESGWNVRILKIPGVMIADECRLIDLSHASERAAETVLDITMAPVAYTHSFAYKQVLV
jgi:microsomal dipeptidase-like Zn-dependent dipeptidase